jgi:hypothetical protein
MIFESVESRKGHQGGFMLKGLAIAALFVFSFSAVAAPASKAHRKPASDDIKCAADPNQGIGIDPDFVIKQVQAATSCYQASHIVESCGAGSSMDGGTTSAAADFCDKQTGKLSNSDVALQKSMLERCRKVCNPQTDGTLCISQQAFCNLDVAKFMNSVNSKNN